MADTLSYACAERDPSLLQLPEILPLKILGPVRV